MGIEGPGRGGWWILLGLALAAPGAWGQEPVGGTPAPAADSAVPPRTRSSAARVLPPVPRERPRIGLVLSGGGARGFAHLGVLRVLDELRIPVDAVAGTSMGAVVGGLYAAGIPYEALERIFRQRDWSRLFDDDPPRPELRLRRKREERELTLPLEIGVGAEGVRFPPGIISGGKLYTLLQIHTHTVREVMDFDDLPVPFRAVATDVTTGEGVVLEGGSLPDAIRASMAVPAVFTPVEAEGRLLVDGGVVNNLPVDVARSMGTDVLLVVDVSTDLEELGEGAAASAPSILQRVLTIFTQRNVRQSLAELTDRDLLLRPDLEGIRVSDFSELEAGLTAGEDVARAAAGALRRLSLPEAAWERRERARTANWLPDPTLTPRFLAVDTTETRLAAETVRRMLPFRSGDTITTGALEEGVVDILGYGGFSRVGFEIAGGPAGPVGRGEEGEAAGRPREVGQDAGLPPGAGLLFRPRDKPWGPGILRGGLFLADRQRGAATWGLLANYTHTRLNGRGGELRAQLQIGSDQDIRVEFYQPLDPGERFFAAARAQIGRRDERVPSVSGALESFDLTESGLSAFAGLRLAHWGEARLGLFRGTLDAEVPEEPGSPLARDADVSTWLLQLEADVLDRVAFPSRGLLFLGELRRSGGLLGGDEDFDLLRLEGLGARSWGRHTLLLGGLVATALGSDPPLARETRLGGLFRLTGLEPSGLRGPYAGLAKLVWWFRPGGPASAADAGPLRLGLALEAGGAWDAPGDVALADILLGTALLVGIDTPMGPAHAGWGWTETHAPAWVLRLGPVF